MPNVHGHNTWRPNQISGRLCHPRPKLAPETLCLDVVMGKAVKIHTNSIVPFADMLPEPELEQESDSSCWSSMYGAQPSTRFAQLRYLPALTRMPTLEALENFPPSETFFLATYDSILGEVVLRAGLLRLQKLFCIVIAVGKRPEIGGMRNPLSILTDFPRTIVELPCLTVSLLPIRALALHSSVSASKDIKYLEWSFAASRLRRPRQGPQGGSTGGLPYQDGL